MKSTDILQRVFGNIEIYSLEQQNSAYEGCLFYSKTKDIIIRTRLAKKTSKKAGYFVAFWEKDAQANNTPFKAEDSPELLAVVIDDENKKGIFTIPKEIAVEKQILSTADQNGKMAMRFYPVWCHNLNQTALQTQKWQLHYFKNLSE
jgi:hypothetical protein